VNDHIRKPMSRRVFLRSFGIAAGSLAGLGGLTAFERLATPHPKLAAAVGPIREWTLAFTDGWVAMPAQAAPVPPFFPDSAAPSGYSTYVMGIRDLGYLSRSADLFTQKGKAQISGPLLWANENDDVRLTLWNLGLEMRPDLTDSHTVHWHGFPNQIAYFDGVPDASLSAPIGRNLTYRYIPRDPGTYMYHCHVEDVEHVHMGLTGLVFVMPAVNTWKPGSTTGNRYAYNVPAAQLPQVQYDREFALFISEINNHAHWNDRHKQDTDWTDYNADFSLFNGRAWPDTVEPPGNRENTIGGRLQHQPLSSLIQANAGERVLIRMANLGFQEHSILLPGLAPRIVGRDAKPMVAGRPAYDANEGAASPTRGDISNVSYRVDIGPGESRDLIFVAPNVTAKTVYPVYDREYGFVNSTSGDGYGGMRTEIRVYPAGTVPPQSNPHETFSL
jgi:FtsP/CotA-like multicopper oxidase with cupredoxin domain